MIPFPDKKYKVIYAVPPWSYAAGGKKRNVKRHYSTMKPKDIFELPVQDIADDDCFLFMWATFPTLGVALEAIERWGFTYKTAAFVWCKKNKKSPGWFWGLGNYTRANAEVCLLAIKGRPERVSKSVHSIIEAPVGRHSQKPSEVRDRIVQLAGDVPAIELFARESVPGWDAWGDEVEPPKTCSVCGCEIQDDVDECAADCPYKRQGLSTCGACCEICHKTEPFPCREYERGNEKEVLTYAVN